MVPVDLTGGLLFLQLSGFTSEPREVCSCLYDLKTVLCKSFSILSKWGAPPGVRDGGFFDLC